MRSSGRRDSPSDGDVPSTAENEAIQDADRMLGIVAGLDDGIGSVAAEIGVLEGTLGRWVRQHKEADPQRFATSQKEPVPWAEHQKALAENAKLKQEIEFLGKVSAFFAAKQQ